LRRRKPTPFDSADCCIGNVGGFGQLGLPEAGGESKSTEISGDRALWRGGAHARPKSPKPVDSGMTLDVDHVLDLIWVSLTEELA